MRPCSRCERPLLPGTSLCPFCGVRLNTKWLALAAGTVLTPFILSACYGGPPCAEVDRDGDGFSNCVGGWDGGFVNDCDDLDGSINPDAIEVCTDAVDNNCDGLIASEDAVEVCGNNIDDNCNGEVDEAPEGGFVEILCDNGLDDDCDGLVDAADPDCETPIDDPPGVGGIALSLAFDGATDCADAGISILRITPSGPESIAPYNVGCGLGPITIPSLRAGTWRVSVSGATYGTPRTWDDESEAIAVSADATTDVSLSLECSGPDGNPCSE